MIRWYFIEMFGTRIIPMREDRARNVVKLLPAGTWALLADGTVGIKESHFKRLRCTTGHPRTMLDVAQALHKLGRLNTNQYLAILKQQEALQETYQRSEAADDLLHAAKSAGITLTKTQMRQIEKIKHARQK